MASSPKTTGAVRSYLERLLPSTRTGYCSWPLHACLTDSPQLVYSLHSE
jgi:hypothetical protein